MGSLCLVGTVNYSMLIVLWCGALVVVVVVVGCQGEGQVEEAEKVLFARCGSAGWDYRTVAM